MSAPKRIVCCVVSRIPEPRFVSGVDQPSAVAPGSPTCGPHGEDTTYVTAAGQIVNGTRSPLDQTLPTTATMPARAIQITMPSRRACDTRAMDSLLRYRIRTANRLIRHRAFPTRSTHTISTHARAFNVDIPNNLVVTYEYQLPLERLTKRAKLLTQGWAISGITRVTSGFPVTISEDADNSLQGSIPMCE